MCSRLRRGDFWYTTIHRKTFSYSTCVRGTSEAILDAQRSSSPSSSSSWSAKLAFHEKAVAKYMLTFSGGVRRGPFATHTVRAIHCEPPCATHPPRPTRGQTNKQTDRQTPYGPVVVEAEGCRTPHCALPHSDHNDTYLSIYLSSYLSLYISIYIYIYILLAMDEK